MKNPYSYPIAICPYPIAIKTVLYSVTKRSLPQTIVITVNRLLTESPVHTMLTNMLVLSIVRSFREYQKMDFSEDFALLLLAEEETTMSQKNRGTNKQKNS